MQGLGSTRSPLEAGALVTLVTLGIAGILGVVAVLDENHEAAAFGTGLGIAVVVFLSGATIVCGLACLARGRIAVIALTSTAVAGIALDLVVLAIWRDIGNDTYAKVAGIAAAWTFFALVALGLTLAVDARGRLSRPLYLGAALSTLVAALISTYLIATAGGDSLERVHRGAAARHSAIRSTRATTRSCACSAPCSSFLLPSGSPRSRLTASSSASTTSADVRAYTVAANRQPRVILAGAIPFPVAGCP